MDIKDEPIGFFDSGVGGLSVLREAVKLLPNENFIYFGDSKNAPYGVRELSDVQNLTVKAAEFLYKKNVKAIVIACNTATSAAIEILRNKYKGNIIIGIEPALKPAVELKREGKIIIMATPMTLREKKFKNLMLKYKDRGDIVSVPCPRLVEFVEKGILEGAELEAYLSEKFKSYSDGKIAAVVLGCTHYPFVKNTLAKVIGENIPIIDGGHGTSSELKRQLSDKSILSERTDKGNVQIYNSLNDKKIIDFCYNLINTR